MGEYSKCPVRDKTNTEESPKYGFAIVDKLYEVSMCPARRTVELTGNIFVRLV